MAGQSPSSRVASTVSARASEDRGWHQEGLVVEAVDSLLAVPVRRTDCGLRAEGEVQP